MIEPGFFWFTPQIPPVWSKPCRIFRSLRVFTKTSWRRYVNFKYWFPISSFIELSLEAALHMFETLILYDCACVLSALCVIFFYLENICFPFHRVWQNIWFAVPIFESIDGDDWAPGLGHSLCVLKHIISNLRLIYLKGKRLSERSPLMTKFFELGSNTFSPKWRCFGLSAYLVECKHLFQKFQPFWPKSNFYSNLFRSKTNEQPSCFILHHPCLQCLLRLFI